MGFELYKTRIKCLLRNKENMFWCYMFPIILATCFFFAFGQLHDIDTFETISIAYDGGEAKSDPLREALEEAKTSEGTPMFSVIYCDREKAGQLMDNNEIEGYITGSIDPKLYVKESGINETIIKFFLDSYRQLSLTVQKIVENNPQAVNEGLLDDVKDYKSFVQDLDKNKRNPDGVLIYFYSLMAYTCIYAAAWGLDEGINIQADQSPRGARISISPIHKMKLFMNNMAASYTVHIGSLILLFVYMFYFLKVDFGDSLMYIFLTCLIGSFTGLTMGAVMGVWFKQKREVKDAVLTAIVLGFSFLSGLMVQNMKYIIASKLPGLSYINPVNLVTDALYSLYYYDTFDRFALNILILVVMSVVFTGLSYIGMRRKTYESI